MASLRVERLDHCGLVAWASKACGLLDMLDARLVPDEPEVMPPGEAVAGMRRNGVGFPHRPLALTPPFFAKNPLALLWHDGGEAQRFNRFPLGRTLEAVQAYGGDLLCRALAWAVCTRARLAQRFTHLDTTRFARRGASGPASAAQAIPLTHGAAQDHRPDLQPAVLALRVSPDGGGPCVRNSGEGHASETKSVQERAEAVLATLPAAPGPRSRVADATRYTEAQAATLAQCGCLTRMPGPRTRLTQVLTQALPWDTGHRLAATIRSPRLEVGHDGMAQRWWVGASQAALERAEARVTKAWPRAAARIDKPRGPWHATRSATPEAAQAALATLATAWRSPQGATSPLLAPKHYARQGRPPPP